MHILKKILSNKEYIVKKFILFLAIGVLLIPAVMFAQTTQGAQGDQSTDGEYFGGGGYHGPILGITAIEDLLFAAPNEFVIVEGYLIQRRVPGSFILADDPVNPMTSVILHLNPYFWANLEIDPDTPVLVYATVNRSELRIELEAVRIEIQ